jgi:hypothetical protein
VASERLDREFRHALRRCPKLSDAEIRLLALVASYSEGCLLSYDEICKLTPWKRAKLKRTVQSLVNYGLLERSYRCYKRVTLKIAPASVQAEFARAYDGSTVSHDSRLTQEPVMAHQRTHDGSPMSQPIIERELERKLENAFLDNSEKGECEPVDVGLLIANQFPSWKRNP